jgi:very-short-patch-repair endonuclease
LPTGDSRHSKLEEHLAMTLRAVGLPDPVRQHRFAAALKRQWRFDFCWPAAMLAVEIEGGIYQGGWHTNATGLKRDIEKGNAAVMLGWRVLRFHGDQVRSGEAVATIKQAIEQPAGPGSAGVGDN